MRQLAIVFSASFFFISCTSHQGQNKDTAAKDSVNAPRSDTSSTSDIGYYKIDKDSLVIPSFEIEVSLSPKANAKLKARKETIIVAAYFSGQPKDTTSKEYQESGEMSVAVAQKELRGDERIAKIEGVKFPKSRYDSLADKDIQLLINIFSGRRSTDLNLLSCDILQDKMSRLKNKKFTLNGKLIQEK